MEDEIMALKIFSTKKRRLVCRRGGEGGGGREGEGEGEGGREGVNIPYSGPQHITTSPYSHQCSLPHTISLGQFHRTS